MNGTKPADPAAFLAIFFSPPNRLKVDSKPEISTWADRLRATPPLATVLPCWRAGDTVDWYGLALDDRQFRALGESLTAFIGPTYTTFRGQPARLNLADPVDAAVAGLTGGRAYRFRGTDPKEIWLVLERMRRVWGRRGSRDQTVPQPIGRVLRSFHMAALAGDGDGAEQALTALRDEYHVDGLNLLFLRVQLLASLRRWGDLLALPELPDLIRIRRPVAVTEALLRAVYSQLLARFEEPPNPAAAAVAFRAEIHSRFGGLFASHSGIHAPEAVKGLMLHAVSQEPPDYPVREALLDSNKFAGADGEFLRLLADLVPAAPSAPPGDPLLVAVTATQASDYDRAFALASSAEPSVARTRLLCECAYELGTLDARRAAIEAVNGLPEADRSAFLTRKMNQRLWESLGEASPSDAVATLDQLPSDWCEWLAYLDRNDGRHGSREIAHRGATEWSVEDFLDHARAADFVSRLHGKRSQAAELVLRDCLPHLLAFFERDVAWPNPNLREIYRALIDLLYYSTDGGRGDLALFSELLAATLSLGTGGDAGYSELLSFASDLWTHYAAPATFNWAADTLDLFIAEPCPDPSARQAFFQSILDRSATFRRHVSAEQRAILRLAAEDLGCGTLFSQYFPPDDVEVEEGATDPLAGAASLSIAIYSLTERAARQAMNVLEAAAPGVRVSLCHDFVTTPRLKQLARQADIFVVATGSAKHAATIGIDANRPVEKPTLRPSGRGAASMLTAIRRHLEEHRQILRPV